MGLSQLIDFFLHVLFDLVIFFMKIVKRLYKVI